MNSIDDFLAYNSNDNKIIGCPKEWQNSSVNIIGKNNILVFDGDVLLCDSTINMKGDNSIVYICSAKFSKTRINLNIFTNSVFFLGRNTATTKTINVVISEEKHIFIGARCLLSFDIWFRNSDAHLIYDANTNNRISKTRSIYVGDHVWVGQEAFIGKGTIIGSGSIIGARSFLSNKTIPSNCCAAGMPAKVIRKNVFWDRPNIHSFDKVKSSSVEHFEGNQYKYELDRHTHNFDKIEEMLCKMSSAEEKYEYLKTNFADKCRKNRFFIPDDNKNIKFKTKILKLMQRFNNKL